MNEEEIRERIRRLEESIKSTIRGLKQQIIQKDQEIKKLKENLEACRKYGL